MKALNFILSILRKYRGILICNILAAVAISVMGMLSFCSLSPIIDSFLHPDGQGASSLTIKVTGALKAAGVPTSLSVMVGIFVVFVIATALLQIFANKLIMQTKYDLLKDQMVGAFDDFFHAKWLFFSGNEQGKIYSTLNREMHVLGEGFMAIGVIFSNAVQILFFVAAAFYISWKVTAVCLAVTGVLSAFLVVLSRSAYRLGAENTATSNVFNGLVYENIGNAKLVLGYGNAGVLVERIRKAYDAHSRATIRSQLLSVAILSAYKPVGVVIGVIGLVAARWLAVPVAEVAVLFLSLFQTVNLLGALVGQKNAITSIVPGYEQLQSLRALACQMKQPSGTRLFAGIRKEIVFDNVSFSYPNRETVLHQVSFTIPKGKSVAFVGKSGSGKTTLIDIMMGFHEVSSGRVLLDQVSLSEYEINSYRSRLGYVSQENVLFNMSIRENLQWVKPDATEREMSEACRQAYASEFIDAFPQKYETVVGDRGVRLSGGQIQRLAIARALLRQPEILFLDEATSSLDSHSEGLIQKAIEAVSGKATVVVVAHRLATIRRADIIFVVEKGRIIESGNYQSLCGQGGAFSDMARLQELDVVV